VWWKWHFTTLVKILNDFQKNERNLLWCMSTGLIVLKATYCWRNTHWLWRNLYDVVMLDQMALLPLGLTWVWINIPDSYLTFIKHVIGSGPWLIWTHQFVLSHREVRTISLFTRMGIFICLRGWEASTEWDFPCDR